MPRKKKEKYDWGFFALVMLAVLFFVLLFTGVTNASFKAGVSVGYEQGYTKCIEKKMDYPLCPPCPTELCPEDINFEIECEVIR